MNGHLVLGLLAVALLAAPQEASASAGTRKLVLKPLFDGQKRFKPKKTVRLRFRLQDRTGASVPLQDVSFSLLHGSKEPEKLLPLRKLPNGAFEVPFTPEGPGRYAVLATVRGAKVGSIDPVHLGVVGVADGLVEEPPEADAEVRHRGRGSPRAAVR
ncbi:MAG: hypothetical protein ACJ783_18070 [Myxococcales bacterium]